MNGILPEGSPAFDTGSGKAHELAKEHLA